MYELETSYEEFLKKELEKYPELNLKDIEVLKERVESNKELPPIRGTIIYNDVHIPHYILYSIILCYYNIIKKIFLTTLVRVYNFLLINKYVFKLRFLLKD